MLQNFCHYIGFPSYVKVKKQKMLASLWHSYFSASYQAFHFFIKACHLIQRRSAKIERVQRAVFCMSCCAKNRFAQFLHSGQSFCFLHVVQKTASLNFCTPDNLFVKSSIPF